MTTFNDFAISHDLIRATVAMGFEEATKIQELAIPIALSGKDIIGQAQTGTGKQPHSAFRCWKRFNQLAAPSRVW